MQKLILSLGAGLGALSVMIGAFGAHKLKPLLESNNRLDVFETAVKYQFYHVFLLFAIGLLMFKVNSHLLTYAAWLAIGGIIIFSGSLYILSITNVGKWGAITPIGGLFFIASWVLVAVAVVKAL